MLSASYAACMDVEAAIAEAPAARQSVVDAILNIFPVNDASYNSSDTLDYHDRIALVDLQAYLNTIGVDGILSYSTFQNQFNDSVGVPRLNKARERNCADQFIVNISPLSLSA